MTTDLPRTHPTPTERAFLIAAAGIAPGTSAIGHGLDWEFLLPYAKSHLVLPALGLAVASGQIRGELPPAVQDALVGAAIHNEMQNQVLLADLADAVRALNEARIPSIVLKGAGLMARLPGLVRARHTDDIDLWVEPDLVFEADRVLRAHGYRDLAGSPGPRPGDEPRSHQLPGLLSERGTTLEIHRRPPASDGTRWDDDLVAAERVVVRGVPVAVRDRPSMLRDLCGHVVIHHEAYPALWPRHLRDVTALLEESPDLMRRAAAGARLAERVALWTTSMVLREVRAETSFAPLARRVLFPPEVGRVVLGWAGYRLLEALRREGVARALWPSEAFLRSRGFDPDAGRVRASFARAKDVLVRAVR